LRLKERLFAYEKENTRLLQQWGMRMAERFCTAVGARCVKKKSDRE